MNGVDDWTGSWAQGPDIDEADFPHSESEEIESCDPGTVERTSLITWDESGLYPTADVDGLHLWLGASARGYQWKVSWPEHDRTARLSGFMACGIVEDGGRRLAQKMAETVARMALGQRRFASWHRSKIREA